MPNRVIKEIYAPYRPQYRDMLILRKSPAPDIEDNSPLGVMLDERDIESDAILFANTLSDETSQSIWEELYRCRYCGASVTSCDWDC